MPPVLFAVDSMGQRIDDLEKSISDLMQQAGLDEQVRLLLPSFIIVVWFVSVCPPAIPPTPSHCCRIPSLLSRTGCRAGRGWWSLAAVASAVERAIGELSAFDHTDACHFSPSVASSKATSRANSSLVLHKYVSYFTRCAIPFVNAAASSPAAATGR
jgi:hypothetical protein